jgi:hypothetical protein
MGRSLFSLDTFFLVMLVLTVVLWILWAVANYIYVYGNPGFFWAAMALSFVPQVAATVITVLIFVAKKLLAEQLI